MKSELSTIYTIRVHKTGVEVSKNGSGGLSLYTTHRLEIGKFSRNPFSRAHTNFLGVAKPPAMERKIKSVNSNTIR